MPPLAEQAHVEALVKAFGSAEVLACMESWRRIVLEMIKNDRLI